jgi:hypothetical protein
MRGDEFGVHTDGPHRTGAARRAERVVVTGEWLGEEASVVLAVCKDLQRQVALIVNGLDRAHRLARAAVHALVGVDVKGTAALVDAIDRAFVDATAIQDVDARFTNYISHVCCSYPEVASHS